MSEQDLHNRAEQTGLLIDGTRAGTPLGAGALRRLCCEAELVPVVLGSHSEILDVGQTVRLVTPEIRRALTFRDRGCVFQGCNVGPTGCEAHHITPWWQGGPTALANLALLCPHHHALVEPRRQHPPGTGTEQQRGEELRWSIRMSDNGRPQVVAPGRLRSSAANACP